MPLACWYPFHTHHLLDCTSDSEYSALSASQKNTFNLIVSAGIINFSAGSPVRLKFEAMFPVGTTTRTNIEALLSYSPISP